MQVKVFDMGAPDETINAFMDTHDVVQNGIVVRENQIVILYNKKEEEKDQIVRKMTNTLNVFKDQYVEASINHSFYLKLELAGRGDIQLSREVQSPMGPQMVNSTVSQEVTKAKATLESVKAQILVLEDLIKNPPVIEQEPVLYGKKQYKTKESKE